MRRALRIISILILGALLGASAMSVHTSRQIEQLMYSVRVLNEELAAARQETAELRANLTSERRQVVTGIKVEIEFADDLTAHQEKEAHLAVEKKVKEWLAPLYGQEVATLNPRLVPRIIDGREVEVENLRFVLTTRIVFAGEEFLVLVDAEIKGDRHVLWITAHLPTETTG
jgi:flagellar basal body-associated protein FliL